jgi:hypothetical protein
MTAPTCAARIMRSPSAGLGVSSSPETETRAKPRRLIRQVKKEVSKNDSKS